MSPEEIDSFTDRVVDLMDQVREAWCAKTGTPPEETEAVMLCDREAGRIEIGFRRWGQSMTVREWLARTGTAEGDVIPFAGGDWRVSGWRDPGATRARFELVDDGGTWDGGREFELELDASAAAEFSRAATVVAKAGSEGR